ncbi:hypothetical protein D3229_06655 [Leucobacter aridicollis]|nr:hypothetical protein [Leucobacter aridicollis]
MNYLKNRKMIEMSVTPPPAAAPTATIQRRHRRPKVTPASQITTTACPALRLRSARRHGYGYLAAVPYAPLSVDPLAAQREGGARELAVSSIIGLPTVVLACPGSATRFAERRT